MSLTLGTRYGPEASFRRSRGSWERKLRSTYLVRRVVFALAVSVTSFAGASAITNAASDAPVVDDIDLADPVYRTTPYGSPTARIDLDPHDRNLTYAVVEQPKADDSPVGTARVRGDTVILTMDRDAAAGSASFTYRATDSDGKVSGDATVSFEVGNRTPLTRDLTLTTQRDAAMDIWPYARDAEDGGPFPWTQSGNRVTYTDPKHGTIEPFFGSDGDEPTFAKVDHKAVYVPDPGYVGADSFSYTFTDEDGDESTSRVSVDVGEPETPENGARHGVRYRCASHMRSDSDGEPDADGRFDSRLTEQVARILGGDLVLEVDAALDTPRTLAPRESYELGRPALDLSMQAGATELLAGAPVKGGGLDLDSVGLGQSSVGAEVTASTTVRSTARGEVRDVSIEGLSSRPRPVAGPEGDNELTMSMRGSSAELTAPRRGKVVVSLPQVFGLNLRLEPGLRGHIDRVGLRCYAPGNERLELAEIPVR